MFLQGCVQEQCKDESVGKRPSEPWPFSGIADSRSLLGGEPPLAGFRDSSPLTFEVSDRSRLLRLCSAP